MQYIHTKTREEYDQLMDIFEKKGWEWTSWKSPKKWNWYREGENTCISNENAFWYINLIYVGKDAISFQNYLKLEGLLFTRWERVLVSGNGDHWYNKIYIAKIEWAASPYITVDGDDEDEFSKWGVFRFWRWKHIKKLEKPETVTITLSKEDHDKVKKLLNI